MSNLPTLDSLALETVTGGTSTPCTPGGSSSLGASTGALATQLQSITSSLKDLGNVKKSSGFDNSTMLMLAFMASQQNRGANVVYVHRGWF